MLIEVVTKSKPMRIEPQVERLIHRRDSTDELRQSSRGLYDLGIWLRSVAELGNLTVRCGLVLAILMALSGSASAILVGTDSSIPAPNTTSIPNDDPGWASISSSNYVYLGDGWVLSPLHVGYSDATGIVFGSTTYKRISGSYYTNYGFTDWDGSHAYGVANPPGLGLTPNTDLHLFRINGDPGVPALKLATQSLPAGAPQVIMVGSGAIRAATETHWNIFDSNPSSNEDLWNWNSPNPNLSKDGYVGISPRTKQWGTNTLADPHASEDLYDTIFSNTTGALKLTARQLSVIVGSTRYDKFGQNGATAFEAQAVGGDSGTAVFYKRGGQWELAGVVNAISTFNNQPASTAVYGNNTLFSDLSYYNQNYANSISDIIGDHPNYSTVGDVNLDGIVSGNGSGPTATDDVSAFVAGWGNINYVDVNGIPTPKGAINSWKKGDLNRDGKTDVSDFFLLRDALNTPISGSVVQSLFGSTAVSELSGVPEPATACLAIIAAGYFSLLLCRRTRSAVG